MPTDIALGVITIVMAVLGGIVSAHAPTKAHHKWAYAIGFVVLAGIGIAFVFRLSSETASTNAHLSDTLGQLRVSTSKISTQAEEISRAEAKNFELQKALLSQSATTTTLSK